MSKRTVLITGCSDGGLGAALSLAFHATGKWRVFATARNPSKMSSLKAEGIETISLDVQSESSLKQAVAEVSKLTGGKLDALINNAGSGYSMPVSDLDVNEAKKVFDLNVWSVLATSQAFLPLLLAAGKGAMLIVNTSVASVAGVPFQSAYNASKSAAAMFTDAMRLELEPFGIKVIDLKTGAVKSNFFQNLEQNITVHLPENSIYNVAREPVEKLLSGESLSQEMEDSKIWAANVVRDLSKKNPPTQVWRGGNSGRIWFAQNLPKSLMDGPMRGLSGLNEVDKALKAKK